MKFVNFKKLKFIINIIVFLSITLFTSGNVMAKLMPSSTKAPMKILVNPYVAHLYDLDPAKSSYKAIVWLNTTYPNKTSKHQRQIEFVNSVTQKKTLSYTKKNADGTYSNFSKYYLTLNHHFDLSRYPFDKQTFKIKIEDAHSDSKAAKLHYIAPLLGVKRMVESTALPQGWKLLKVSPNVVTHTYHSSFSHKNRLSTSNFSRLNINILLKRENTRLFFSLFIMLYLAYILSLFALVMPPTVSYFNTTSGLIAASVFSLVGNFIISSKLLLHTLSFTLIDKVQLTTLLIMLATYAVLIYNSYLARANRVKLAHKIRFGSIICSVTIYVITNILIFT